MANIDSPMGFKPVGHYAGGTIRARRYTIDETAPTIYQGDAVILNHLSGAVDLAAAGDTLLGVAAETHVSGSANILVYDDPNILYEIQGYTGVTFSASHCGETADLVATAGNSTLKQSRMEVNEPELDPNSQLLILEKADRPDNAWGEHVKLIVKIAQHHSTELVST